MSVCYCEGSLNDLLKEFVYLLHYYTKEPDDGLKKRLIIDSSVERCAARRADDYEQLAAR